MHDNSDQFNKSFKSQNRQIHLDNDKHIVGVIDYYHKVVALDKKDNTLGKFSSSYSDIQENNIEKIIAKHSESETVIIIDVITNINEGD